MDSFIGIRPYLITLVVNLIACTSAISQTAEHPNYPVITIDSLPGAIGIVDDIDSRTPLAFERVLQNMPNPRLLFLSSSGGDVNAALTIATRVRSLGLNTLILKENECYSACALIFFAGANRLALGELGVHQIRSSTGGGNLVAGQFVLADILEVLASFDVQTEIIAIMLRTPPEDMYVFSSDEKRRFGFIGEPDESPDHSVETADKRVSKKVDLNDPQTWRGRTIYGRLVSNGKRWMARLNSDGTTEFTTTNGNILSGSYRIRNGSICFLYIDAVKETCRTPREVNNRIRWYNETGGFSSFIERVDNSRPTSPKSSKASEGALADLGASNKCALIVAARPTRDEAIAYARQNISDQRYLRGFRGKNGWIAISIGTLEPHEVEPIMTSWKAIGKIPQDSYCSFGSNFVGEVDIRPR